MNTVDVMDARLSLLILKGIKAERDELDRMEAGIRKDMPRKLAAIDRSSSKHRRPLFRNNGKTLPQKAVNILLTYKRPMTSQEVFTAGSWKSRKQAQDALFQAKVRGQVARNKAQNTWLAA